MRKLLVVLLGALSLVACGGPAEEAGGDETVGGEVAGPVGPPPTFLPAASKVRMRLDMARVRRSETGPDISSAIRATETWQQLAGSSGLDPVADVDAVLVGADGLYAERRTVVLRHPHTDAELRDRVMQMAMARGAQAVWTEVDGIATTPLPIDLRVEHTLLLTASHEVVITPTDDVARVVEIALDHRARRTSPEEIIEPNLALAAGEILTASIEDPPAREGYPTPPRVMHVAATEDEASARVILQVMADFATEADAVAARSYFEGQGQYYAQQLMVRAIGMHRPIEAARWTQAGEHLEVTTDLTQDEVRRVLGLMALSQMTQ